MREDAVKRRHAIRQAGILALDWRAVYEWTKQKPAGEGRADARLLRDLSQAPFAPSGA